MSLVEWLPEGEDVHAYGIRLASERVWLALGLFLASRLSG